MGLPCPTDHGTDTYAGLLVTKKAMYSNEETIRPKEVTQLSEQPSTWRIVRITSIAPPEIQGQAEIFVLNAASLTITDGEESHQYVRCN